MLVKEKKPKSQSKDLAVIQPLIPGMSPKEARDALWRMGVIAPWKLDEKQKEEYTRMNTAFTKGLTLTWVGNWARRRGKSRTNIVDAIEQGIRTTRGIFRYACETQTMVKDIIEPLIDEICIDAPEDVRPFWSAKRRGYYFPSSGSILKIAGCDTKRNANRLRGTACHRGYIDECGQIKHLDYVLNSLLMPQLLTTGGHISMFSTPSEEIASDWYWILEKNKLRGTYSELNIYTNPRLTAKTIQEFADECGGTDSITFKREYLCQFEKDPTRQVIPQWEQIKDKVLISGWERPSFFDVYESMDIGFRDLTFYLSGYFDYKNNVLIIEKEIVKNGAGLTTDVLAEEIIKSREENYGKKKPHKSVMDTDLRLKNDLSIKHGLNFIITQKEDKHTHLNHMIMELKAGRIKIVEANCPILISHINAAIWDNNRKDYKRVEGFGHFDGIDSLLYFSRAIDRSRDPYPLHHGIDVNNTFIPNIGEKKMSKQGQSLADAFGIKNKRR